MCHSDTVVSILLRDYRPPYMPNLLKVKATVIYNTSLLTMITHSLVCFVLYPFLSVYTLVQFSMTGIYRS